MIELVKAQSQKLEVGHTYYIGASDSPKLVLVLAVDESRVRVVNPYGETMKSYALSLREAELLAARGGKARFAKRERHGAPAAPRDFDVYEVSLRPVLPGWDNTENWRAAEEYGAVSGCIATELLDVSRVRGADLAKLVADERFTVVKLELVEQCARA